METLDLSAARHAQKEAMLETTVHHLELSAKQKVFTEFAKEYTASVALYGGATIDELSSDIIEQLSERGASKAQIGIALQAAVEYLEQLVEAESNT